MFCTTRTLSIAILIGLLSIGAVPPAGAQSKDTRPNILFVIADDLGLDATPCYPGTRQKARMPNLEKLCAEGIVYDNAWTTPLCSPTRAALITGRYGFNNGIGFAINPKSAPGTALRDDEITLHRLLAGSSAPYAVGHFGKWHLAHRDISENDPARVGVPHFDGHTPGTPMPGYSQWRRTINGKTQASSEYMTTAFTSAAIDWIGTQRQPWLVWLAYTAPHDPFHLPPAHLHSRRDLDGSAQSIKKNPLPYYDAMLEAMDTEFGRLLASLTPQARANTLVVFLGDNGTDFRIFSGGPRAAARDASKAKGTLYQGGVAVPLIVAGAGVTRRGERDATLVDATDFFPTFAEVAGARFVHPINGMSFAGTFSRTSAGQRRFAHSELFDPTTKRDTHGWVMRDERYKLIQWEDGRSALFDLTNDWNENHDLLASGGSPALEARARALREARAAFFKRP